MRSYVIAVAVALGALTAGQAAGFAPARAADDNRPTAVVTLGDSYISGEAGRWQGNSPQWLSFGDRWGTDRAAYNCRFWTTTLFWVCDHDPRRVYGSTYDSGCDRSDVAEVQTAPIAVERRFNLACSGAKTVNVLRSADGGQPFKRERPQADQLVGVARNNNVKLVVLSIGGNDLGFSDIIQSCYLRWQVRLTCTGAQEPKFLAGLAATRPKVTAALDSIRRSMSAAGYQTGDYRLVLQSYPSPLTHPSQSRAWTGSLSQGCPFMSSDTAWVRNEVVPAIAAMLRSAAENAGAEFLDLQNAFQGHEVCAKTADQATAANSRRYPIASEKSEWARYTVVFTQGIKEESLHPNAYGQMALGDCLGKLWGVAPGKYGCSNTANNSPTTMVLNPLT